MSPDTWTTQQIAEFIGVNDRQVQRYVRDHGCPTVHVGRPTTINRHEFFFWAAKYGWVRDEITTPHGKQEALIHHKAAIYDLLAKPVSTG